MTTRVAMYFLGGTISMSSADGTGVAPVLGADELIAAIPGLEAADVALTGESLAREQSGSLALEHVLSVLERARSSDADGFVLVQGTDTLEESAYVLDLLWDDERPFVVTGAMRNPTMAGADGAANMLASIRVATTPHARGRGVMLVFADEIHDAREVRKADTSSIAAFVSPTAGASGRVLEGQVHLFGAARPRHVLSPPTTDSACAAEVPIITPALGLSARSLRAVADGADALVIAGFGAGHVPGWWADDVEAIATRIPVVMASRTFSGPTLLTTYGAVGAEVDLQQRGVVMSRYLNPYQARLALILTLASGMDRGDVERTVRELGGR